MCKRTSSYEIKAYEFLRKYIYDLVENSQTEDLIFRLPNGEAYTPDFYSKDKNLIVEYKDDEDRNNSLYKIKELAKSENSKDKNEKLWKTFLIITNKRWKVVAPDGNEQPACLYKNLRNNEWYITFDTTTNCNDQLKLARQEDNGNYIREENLVKLLSETDQNENLLNLKNIKILISALMLLEGKIAEEEVNKKLEQKKATKKIFAGFDNPINRVCLEEAIKDKKIDEFKKRIIEETYGEKIADDIFYQCIKSECKNFKEFVNSWGFKKIVEKYENNN